MALGQIHDQLQLRHTHWQGIDTPSHTNTSSCRIIRSYHPPPLPQINTFFYTNTHYQHTVPDDKREEETAKARRRQSTVLRLDSWRCERMIDEMLHTQVRCYPHLIQPLPKLISTLTPPISTQTPLIFFVVPNKICHSILSILSNHPPIIHISIGSNDERGRCSVTRTRLGRSTSSQSVLEDGATGRSTARYIPCEYIL